MNLYLGVWDYLIIGISLLLSAGFGLYNGCLKTKQSTFFEYFLGSQSITMLPLAISSFATTSAFSSEVYLYGIGALLIVVPHFLLIPLMNELVIPVFRKLSSGNIFEFYEIRYNTTFKKVAIILYIFASINFASMTVYGPSTAISLVTQQNMWVVVIVMMAICMIYTIFGGMRAVVFADTIQGFQMLAVIGFLMIFGTISTGGISEVWNISSKGERLQLDFSMDPTITHTAWSSMIGWMSSFACFFATHQPNIQRLLACATIKQAKTINTISVIMLIITICFVGYLGLIAYATFSKCDPLINNEIKNMNQIFPYYVMKSFVGYPGLSGLYFAGLIAASLSTLSSFINSIACISIDTFILPKYPSMSEVKRTNFGKLLSFLYGGFTVLAVFFVQSFPNIMQGGATIIASVSCPLFALFVVGICCPRVNRKGGIAAFMLSFSFGIWLIIGVLLFPSSMLHIKPRSNEGCPINNTSNMTLFDSNLNFNSTVSTFQYFNETTENILNVTNSLQSSHTTLTNSLENMKGAFPFASISYLWVGCIIFLLPVVLSFIFTCILGKNEVDEKFLEYIPPIIQRYHNSLSQRQRELLLCDVPQTNKNEYILTEECVPLANGTMSQNNKEATSTI